MNKEDIEEIKDVEDFDFEPLGTLPVLALRGLVIFPDSVIHFDVSRSVKNKKYDSRE